MKFKSRQEAGEKLIEKLVAYKNDKNAMILTLPRGGVVLGKIVADALKLPLDLVVPRKIGAQYNQEYAIGAVTENGDAVWNEDERSKADPSYLDSETRKQVAEAKRRLDVYRQSRPPRDVRGKTVILVDDGIATGYTIRAAIKTVRAEGAKKIVIAVPVAPTETIAALAHETDEIIVLYAPALFFAIGGFYGDFPQVDDQTVIDLFS